MPVYATHGDPTFEAAVPSAVSFTPPESPMSRRNLTVVAVAIVSLAVSACNSSPTGPQPTGPRFDPIVVPDTTSRIGTTGSNG